MKNIYYPKVSVIIPVLFGGSPERSILSISKVKYPRNRVEVILACGKNPSRQRNIAAAKAKGEILYFLDNDSEIKKDAFEKVVKVFYGKITKFKSSKSRGFSFFPKWISDFIVTKLFSGLIYNGEIGAVGGPNIWGRKESFWASISSAVLESFFAHFLMAARYRPIGPTHRATEKELILCNLAIKKDVFDKIGGFNETLYPNEENELLNRMRTCRLPTYLSPWGCGL